MSSMSEFDVHRISNSCLIYGNDPNSYPESMDFLRLSDKDIKLLLSNAKYFVDKHEIWMPRNSWRANWIFYNSITKLFFSKKDLFIGLINSEKMCASIRQHLYREEIFFSEKCHFDIASDRNVSMDVRSYAASRVKDPELLKKLIKSKDAKVRKEAYRSAGIEKNIESIAKDRSGVVRLLGIRHLPFGSSKLKLFIEKEKKGLNLQMLLTKLSKNDLLFVISAKSRSSYSNGVIARILKDRLGQ